MEFFSIEQSEALVHNIFYADWRVFSRVCDSPEFRLELIHL